MVVLPAHHPFLACSARVPGPRAISTVTASPCLWCDQSAQTFIGSRMTFPCSIAVRGSPWRRRIQPSGYVSFVPRAASLGPPPSHRKVTPSMQRGSRMTVQEEHQVCITRGSMRDVRGAFVARPCSCTYGFCVRAFFRCSWDVLRNVQCLQVRSSRDMRPPYAQASSSPRGSHLRPRRSSTPRLRFRHRRRLGWIPCRARRRSS